MRRLLASVVESVFHAGDIPQSHSTRFSDDLSASISLDAFTLDSLSGNAPLPRSGMSLNWDAATNTAVVQLTNTNAGILDNGWYEATWSDEALPINAEHRHAFRWVQGDLNHDGVVSNQDIGLFLDLLNGSPPAGTGPAYGDMNRDGVVNNQDISPFINALVFGVQMPNPLTSPGQLDSWALSSTSIRINWTPPIDGNPDGYRIFRSTDGTNFTQVAELVNPELLPGGFFWDDTNLSHGTKYWYRIRPFTFAAGNGHTTDKHWSVTVLPAPTPVALEGGDQLVRVVWDDNSDTESAFRITLRRSGSPQQVVVDEVVPSELVSVAGSRRSWLVSGLDSSTSYDVTVAAIRDGGAVSSAPVPFASSVSTNAGQAVPTGGEIIAAAASGQNYPGVQWTISPDLTNMNTVLRNDTLTIDVTGLPRHTFARLSLSVDAWTEGNVADGVTFTVRAGTHSATMVRQNDWPGDEARWTLGDTALADWFEHVGESMSITITASGFPAERGGGTGGGGTTIPPAPGSYWTLHNFSLSTGIPTVSVVAEDAVATEGADPADNGTFRFERSGPGQSRALVAHYDLSGTATNGQDYQQLDGKVVFSPGQTSKLVDVVAVNDGTPEVEENAVPSVQEDGTIFVAGSPLEPSVALADNLLTLDTSKVNVGLPKTGGTDTFFVRVLKNGERVAVPAPLCVSKPLGVSLTFGEYSQNGERRVTVTSEGLITGPGHKIVLGVENDETIRLEMAVVITE